MTALEKKKSGRDLKKEKKREGFKKEKKREVIKKEKKVGFQERVTAKEKKK